MINFCYGNIYKDKDGTLWIGSDNDLFEHDYPILLEKITDISEELDFPKGMIYGSRDDDYLDFNSEDDVLSEMKLIDTGYTAFSDIYYGHYDIAYYNKKQMNSYIKKCYKEVKTIKEIKKFINKFKDFIDE